MSNVGQRERQTQHRVVKLFKSMRYDYLGNWEEQERRSGIEEDLLTTWLRKQGINDTLINKALRQLAAAAALGEGKKLYYANEDVYRLLRYGVKDKEETGKHKETIWLIDWANPENNHFAVAEEVTIKGEKRKRPDIVLYVNGIALGVIELKRSSVSIGEGIRQNLDNQKKDFIRNFFTTMQLVMAGNDTQGLRYGTIETPEKFYLEWKEEGKPAKGNLLDDQIQRVCEKKRFLEIIHDFIVFDAGIKKTCRHNQYFGVKAAQQSIAKRQGGIIWHTQGSGKSLSMVWLAKWIREHKTDSRVLIVTDRTELDQQIEEVFQGVDEKIERTTSGAGLIATLNQPSPWLICSLVHKFGRRGDDEDDEATAGFLAELRNSLPQDFSAKGDLYVFVDECHRTQSGRLHDAMKQILPEAMFIGFTGTPLLKMDKRKSVETFGPYIHTYKFDEAVEDGVVLDLRYEARDIDQRLTSQKKVDEWFEAKTRGLSTLAKSELKKRWGTLQRVQSSEPRIKQIVNDILMDMETKPRLMSGRGNAMLVCASVHQACRVYDMLSRTDLKGKCAIVTSYQPSTSDIKGEESGEGETEKLFKYDTYRKMLAEYFDQDEDKASQRVEEFEKDVKHQFIHQPGQMKLLIVVDKLLTGFDAPSATYLYIDKNMQDHSLFQAICRVNRIDSDDKEYGFIVDYRDLFKSLDKAVSDYTEEVFDSYDAEDVSGLLKDRLKESRQDLEDALEVVKAICEPVQLPRDTEDYLRYFCGDTGNKDDLVERESLRISLYQAVAKLLRAYTNLANEIIEAGFSEDQAAQIKAEVTHYEKMRDEVKLASADYIDMKRYEPAMRQLLDMYIHADPSETLIDFEELGLIELIVQKGEAALDELPSGIRNNKEAVAETIENNIRKTIIDENPVNPKYYEQMSELLEALIEERRKQAIDYQEYLEKVQALARKVVSPDAHDYPTSLDTTAKRALYDNLERNEPLAASIDLAVRETKKAYWVGDRVKERQIRFVIEDELAGTGFDVDSILDLVKNQSEYQ
jgi:type I restriction enzyme, R subunit